MLVTSVQTQNINIDYYGRCDRVQILVALGAGVNSLRTSCLLRLTINHHCCEIQNIPPRYTYNAIFKYLLEHGINPNKVDQYECSVAHYCVYYKSIPALEDLIKAQANLNYINPDFKTPLDTARIRAMDEKIDVADRKKYNKMCQLLQAAGGKSFIDLQPAATSENEAEK